METASAAHSTDGHVTVVVTSPFQVARSTHTHAADAVYPERARRGSERLIHGGGWLPDGTLCAPQRAVNTAEAIPSRQIPSDVASHAVRMPLGQPVLLFAIWFGLVAVATGVWLDVPIIDDWTYAWTVEHLLDTGRFAVLDWSSAYPLSQALWGAVWSALLGFSFVSLRISTLVLAVVGCGALYLMLRELGASTRVSLYGSLSLAVNPLFVFLSSTFMTDVPFIAFTTLALLCYVRASTRGEPRWLWWAGAWCLAAFLTRQVGIITPVAGLPLLLMPAARPAMTRWRVALPLIATWIVLGGSLIALRLSLGTTSAMERWSWNLYARDISVLIHDVRLFPMISFYMLPALMAATSVHGLWRRKRLLAGVAVTTGLLLLLALGSIPLPLRPDETWTLFELGSSRVLIGGEMPAVTAPAWLSVLCRAVGLFALTLFLASWMGRRSPGRSIWAFVTASLTKADVRRRASRPVADGCAKASLLTYLAAYLVIVNLLWMYHDRYYLAFMPPLVALILGVRHPKVRTGRLLVPVALAVFGLIALVGTRDALRYNQAVHDAAQSLVDAGVPPSHIDAGYAWNGWTLYAHPANLGPGQTALRDVPWVTTDRTSEYVISKTPDRDGYVVEREVSWRDLPWPGPDRLFVLKQVGGND